MAVNTPLLDARVAMDAGDLTATALLTQLLDVLDLREPEVRALRTPTIQKARDQARKADERLAAGDRTPVLGIPVVVKDLIDVEGIPTTAGSEVLAENVPQTSSEVWARLEAAGAVLLGKSNTHEFAYGGATEPTRNPADLARIVGGSSGGSAAALAAGYCLGALGSDSAGSIRIPANLCGVAGLKPTRGLVPIEGVLPLAPSMDTVGPMARSVMDLRPILSVIADADATRPAAPWPLKVGVFDAPGAREESVTHALAAAVAAFKQFDADTVEVDIPNFSQTLVDNFVILGFEATLYHRQWAHKWDLYTPYVRDRLADAAKITPEQYADALAAAGVLRAQLDSLLEKVDLILMPGVPFPASPAYDEEVVVAGESEDRDTGLCRNTAFANLTGHPALAVPAGLDNGLPVGVQLVGRYLSDFELIDIGARLEGLLPPCLPDSLGRA